MTELDTGTFQIKMTITETAIDLYLAQDGEFTLNQIAGETDLEVAEIFDYFPDKGSILSFYYTSLVTRYRLMIEEIDDFGSYLLAEKLSNFIYSTFDMMEEKRAFVEQTFKQMVARSFTKTEFESEVEELFRKFLAEDPKIAASSSVLMNNYLYSLFRKKYIYLVKFWLRDESEGRELTIALTDKYTAFIQELFYSAVIDRAVDLLKFMASHKMFIQEWPIVGNILNKIEIRD